MTNDIKQTKRIIRALINSIVLNSIIMIIFLSVIILVVKPWFTQVWAIKGNINNEITNYKNLVKDWNSYDDFKTYLSTKDEGTQKSLDKITKDYYESNLKNTSKNDYITFLKEKETLVSNLKKDSKIEKRDANVNKSLPFYTEGVSVSWNMTDLEFVNYIETILKRFSLKTTASIWIWDLVLANNKLWWNNDEKNDTLESQIFYIPLDLTLEWKKTDIIDFLYFTEKVWITTSVNSDDLVYYKDGFFTSDLNWKNSNIYENKIIDIDKITLPYIDTSSIKRVENQKTTTSFIAFLKNWSEKDDDYNINVWLKFYVRGLPSYKIEIFIWSVLKKFKDLDTKTKKLLADSQNKKIINSNNAILEIITQVKNIELFLTDKTTDIKLIETWLKSRTWLDSLYIKASKMKYDLDNISSILDNNRYKLDRLKK